MKTYSICWGSLTAARRFLHRKDKSKLGKLDDRIISWLGKKLETDCSSVKNTSSGRKIGSINRQYHASETKVTE
jgi:hypothetical protein